MGPIITLQRMRLKYITIKSKDITSLERYENCISWVDCKYIHKFSDQSKFLFLTLLPVVPAVEGTFVLLARTLKVYKAASFVLLKVGNEWPAAHCLQKCWACLQRVWRLRAHKNIYSLRYRKVNFKEACFYFILVTVDCSFDCAYWGSFFFFFYRAVKEQTPR